MMVVEGNLLIVYSLLIVFLVQKSAWFVLCCCVNLTFDSVNQNMEGCWILYTSIGGPYWCNYFCLCCQTKRYQWEIVSPQLFVFKHYALFSAAIIIYLGHHAPHTHITCVSYSFFWLIFLVDIPSIKLPCNAETHWLPKKFTSMTISIEI